MFHFKVKLYKNDIALIQYWDTFAFGPVVLIEMLTLSWLCIAHLGCVGRAEVRNGVMWLLQERREGICVPVISVTVYRPAYRLFHSCFTCIGHPVKPWRSGPQNTFSSEYSGFMGLHISCVFKPAVRLNQNLLALHLTLSSANISIANVTLEVLRRLFIPLYCHIPVC